MDKSGIERSAVFASAIGVGLPTSDMIKKIAPYDDRLFGVAVASPDQHRFQPSFNQMYG